MMTGPGSRCASTSPGTQAAQGRQVPRSIHESARDIAREIAKTGRVEVWRGCCRSNISVAAPFVWRCLTGSALAPSPHTGSSGVVTHPRLPQNVACRFAALRSSGVGSQYCECLQRLVGQPQLWSQQALCYSFESCFHGRCSIPLNRWPYLPLHGGHVAFEQLNSRWPLPHVVGSPNLGVLSASLTAAGSLDRSRLLGLAGPTSLRLNPTALPCSHGSL
jgi:hypothetical protein